MSAFLGPIHYWLYRKVEIQSNLANELANHFDQDLVMTMNEKFETLPEGDLEDFIQTDNIHGWLQEKVHLVEKKLAFAVEQLVELNITIDEIKAVAYLFGSKITDLTIETTAKEAFTFFNNTLLDGMPCDHVNMVKQEDDKQVDWNRRINLHEEFWSQQSRLENRYDQVRDSFIRGCLTNTGLEYKNESNCEFTIINKE
ncbi:hypothetical protein [Anaerosporobacter sp.]